MHVLSYILNWSSVVLNPLIYVATQERYRQAVRYLIQGFAPAAKRTQSFALNRQKQDSAFRSSVSEDHQMS